jgi:serine protease AprX
MEKLFRTKIEKTLLASLLGIVLVFSTVAASATLNGQTHEIVAADSEASYEKTILSYVATEFATAYSIDLNSIKIIESGFITLYGHEIFYADIQVTSQGKHIVFYLNPANNNVRAYDPPSLEELTGITKISPDLWQKLQESSQNDELRLIITFNAPGIESVHDHYPYEKMDQVSELRQEVEQLHAQLESKNSAVDQNTLDAKEAQLAALEFEVQTEMNTIDNQVISNNRAVIAPVVQKGVQELGAIDGVKVLSTVDLAPHVAIIAPVSSIDAIRSLPDVVLILPDEVLHSSLNISQKAIEADRVWNWPFGGSTGSGVNIAVLDSGISGNTNIVVSSSQDFTGSGTTDDQCGHGTEVAGVIASTHSTYKGTSYGANIINAKIATGTTVCNANTSDISSGASWAITFQGAKILNLSYNCDVCTANGNSTLSLIVDYYADKYNVLWVNSAGNYVGASQLPVTAPGDAYNILSVANMDDHNTIGRNDDTWTSGSRICCTVDGRNKPDLIAPGANIHTTTNAGGFADVTGTSFAAPHVAGSAALMKSASSTLTGIQLKALVINGLIINKTSASYSSTQGYGYLDSLQEWLIRSFTKPNLLVTQDGAVNRYIDLSAGEKAAFTITWNRHMTSSSVVKGYSDIDLYVIDPLGNLVTSSISSKDNSESVYFVAPTSGHYQISMLGFRVPSAITPEKVTLSGTGATSNT